MVKGLLTTSLETFHDPHWSDVAHRGLVQQALSFLKIAAKALSWWKVGERVAHALTQLRC
jgi:hypothetical protein